MIINQYILQLLNTMALYFNGSYGLAIIALTLLIRLVLLPLILPSIKSQKKIMDLKPQLDELKKKHGHDKQLFSKKQLELYQKNQVNPISGCLPQIVQIVFFIIFYRVLINALSHETPPGTNINFFWLNLTQPDTSYILPVLTGLTQLILGVMLLPATDTKAERQLAAQTKTKKDDASAADATEMMKTVQSQMVFLMPAMTFFIALRFPSGLALYWVTSTLFSLVQQYAVSGTGGLKPYLQKIGINTNNLR